MKKRNDEPVYSKSLSFAITPKQKEQLEEGHSRSLYRTQSDYIRALMFDTRVHMIYRNQSFDDFMEEGARLRTTMEALRNSGMNSPEDKIRLLVLIEDIKLIMTKIYDVCKPR